MPSPEWKQTVKFIPVSNVSAEITGSMPAYIRLEIFFFSYYALKYLL